MKSFTEHEMKFYKFALILSVSNLTHPQLLAMIFRFAFGMPFRQIAEIEECSWQAVHQRVGVALKKLRRTKRIKDFF